MALRPWRKLARSAMRNASRQEALQRYGTANPSYNYRWEHVKAVVSLALRLAELTGADAEIVEAAAWLHDIEKQVGERHPEEGARTAQELLEHSDFPAEKIERVVRAISNHRGLWLAEPLGDLESGVLWDADKLTKIGLTGAIQLTLANALNGRKMTTADHLEAGQGIDWAERTVASMHTRPAREAALVRLASAVAFWEGLAVELAGADLPLEPLHDESG